MSFLISLLSVIFCYLMQLVIPLRFFRNVLYRYSYLAGFTQHSYTIFFNIILQSNLVFPPGSPVKFCVYLAAI